MHKEDCQMWYAYMKYRLLVLLHILLSPELSPHDRPQVMTTEDRGRCCVTQGATHSPGARLARPDKCAWLECRSHITHQGRHNF